MIGSLFPLVRPALLALDAETAHRLTIEALKWAPLPPRSPDNPLLTATAIGLGFPNPIGLAAGFDKHGEAIGNLYAIFALLFIAMFTLQFPQWYFVAGLVLTVLGSFVMFSESAESVAQLRETESVAEAS